mgnify:CR=1 FL=1
MGQTMIEKIISRNVGVDSVFQTVNVDRVMIHDIFIPFVAEKFEEMGFTKLWAPDKVVLIYDHMVPASTTDDIRHFKIGDAFAKKYGMKNVHRSDGICHQLRNLVISYSEQTLIQQLMVVLDVSLQESVIQRWQQSLEQERCG